jgi:hypothetical protein
MRGRGLRTATLSSFITPRSAFNTFSTRGLDRN